MVWAPRPAQVELCLHERDGSRRIPMVRDGFGYCSAVVDHVAPGSKYLYRLDNSRERPDPASRCQPSGVHGPSEIVDLSEFSWADGDWKGLPLENSVFYELHVGTYTSEGTFAALIPYLDRLADLGVTTIELMPIAQFPGGRNWGYDGTYPFAPQATYGTPRDLQNLVKAAHSRGLAVALDVVYNHLGPEGNYLAEYGPYFTDHYRTPWGAALNFDQAQSDEVRFFFVQNALYWLREFHIDVLRLDAVHSIFDASAVPFLAELSAEVASLSGHLGRQIHLIAESDLNDMRVLRATEDGGFGMNAQWSDDFHHSVHTLLTGESSGYYADFGGTHPLAATLKNGWYYSGQYSKYRQRRHGNGPRGVAPSRLVACSQNHDQVGNRALGERLSQLVDFESLKLAAGVTLLSPFLPLLFMGEEFGETAPFQYFTSHGDRELGEAVRRGREREFASFAWKEHIPDPQSESTFANSKLHHGLMEAEPHRTLWRFYRTLLQLRRSWHLAQAGERVVQEYPALGALAAQWHIPQTSLAILFHFGQTEARLPLPPGNWNKVIASADSEWLGKGEISLPAAFASSEVQQVRMPARSFLALERVRPFPVR